MAGSTKRYHYECSNGHGNGAPYPLDRCNVFLSPHPDAKRSTQCSGTLKPVR